LAIALRNLAATLSAQGQYRDALVKLDEAVKLAKTIVPADAELEFRILDTRGTTYFRQDKFDKAQQCFLQAVAIANRAGRNEQLSRSDLGQVLNNLGTVYLHKKKYPAAEETFGGSVRALESQYGQLHPYVAVPLNNLGLTLLSQSRYSETITVYRRSIEIAEHAGPAYEGILLEALHGLAKVHIQQSEDMQADALLSRALSIIRASPVTRPEAADVFETYSRLFQLQARRIRATTALTVHIGGQ